MVKGNWTGIYIEFFCSQWALKVLLRCKPHGCIGSNLGFCIWTLWCQDRDESVNLPITGRPFLPLEPQPPPNYITVYKIFFYSHNSESWSPFEAEAWHFSVKAHFYRLYPLFYSSGHYPHLLVMGEDRNVDWPMNRKLTFTLCSLLTTTV